MAAEFVIRSGDLDLRGVVVAPRGNHDHAVPGVVLSHGFPSSADATASSGSGFPELADRIANEMGWCVLTFEFRGCGGSPGDFSLGGWLADLEAAVGAFRQSQALSGLWLAGTGTGGALSACAAARDPEIQGVATLGAPADFDDWASHPRRLLDHARELGLIRSDHFPPALDVWARPLREIRAVACMADIAPRSLLVMHGADDDQVPVFDARVLADAHGSAELRVIDGAAHQLRYDPRAVAVLLGWLDRQRHHRPAQSPRIA